MITRLLDVYGQVIVNTSSDEVVVKRILSILL